MLPHVGRQPASTSAAIVPLKVDKKRRKRLKNILSGCLVSLVNWMNDLRWSVSCMSTVRTKIGWPLTLNFGHIVWPMHGGSCYIGFSLLIYLF